MLVRWGSNTYSSAWGCSVPSLTKRRRAMHNVNMAKHDALPDRVLILSVAAKADCDPRTARDALLGKPIRGQVGFRVARAIEALTTPPNSPAPTKPSRRKEAPNAA